MSEIKKTFEYIQLGVVETVDGGPLRFPEQIPDADVQVLKAPFDLDSGLLSFLNDADLGGALNILGQYGWEVCASFSVVHDTSSKGGNEYVFILKHEIPIVQDLDT